MHQKQKLEAESKLLTLLIVMQSLTNSDGVVDNPGLGIVSP